MSKPPKTDFKALIAGQVAPAALPESEPSLAFVETLPVARKSRRNRPVPTSVREGTLKERAHQLSVYLEPPVYDRLRHIAYDERAKLHSLILEAIDLLLKDRGEPSIKQLIKAGQVSL